ncbi:hypothetical protein BaRGS_00001063 [Batillaria attramentaria]|uniref:Uncharacterized protein n=1 Tax=Batillaria attramentaria TaxID=370345 RepID=A0ABD0M5U4_9CAEN
MVMHARKQPRVNDGYTERKDAHLHQPCMTPLASSIVDQWLGLGLLNLAAGSLPPVQWPVSAVLFMYTCVRFLY